MVRKFRVVGNDPSDLFDDLNELRTVMPGRTESTHGGDIREIST